MAQGLYGNARRYLSDGFDAVKAKFGGAATTDMAQTGLHAAENLTEAVAPQTAAAGRTPGFRVDMNQPFKPGVANPIPAVNAVATDAAAVAPKVAGGLRGVVGDIAQRAGPALGGAAVAGAELLDPNVRAAIDPTNDVSFTDRLRQGVRSSLRAGGGILGGAGGAALGSIVPVAGTAAGAIGGGIAGYKAGDAMADFLVGPQKDLRSPAPAIAPVANDAQYQFHDSHDAYGGAAPVAAAAPAAPLFQPVAMDRSVAQPKGSGFITTNGQTTRVGTGLTDEQRLANTFAQATPEGKAELQKLFAGGGGGLRRGGAMPTGANFGDVGRIAAGDGDYLAAHRANKEALESRKLDIEEVNKATTAQIAGLNARISLGQLQRQIGTDQRAAAAEGDTREQKRLDTFFPTTTVEKDAQGNQKVVQGVDKLAQDQFRTYIAMTDPEFKDDKANQTKPLAELTAGKSDKYLREKMSAFKIIQASNETQNRGLIPGRRTGLGPNDAVDQGSAEFGRDVLQGDLPVTDYIKSHIPFNNVDNRAVRLQNGQSVLRENAVGKDTDLNAVLEAQLRKGLKR